MKYRYANNSDIDELVTMRLEFIGVSESMMEYDEIRKNCIEYYSNAFSQCQCDVVIVEEYGKCIGLGVILYYYSVPSLHNKTGKNAYITNLFVEEKFRRNGIGSCVVRRLIDKAKEKGYLTIMLNASEMGKPLYYKLGFLDISNGMIFQNA